MSSAESTCEQRIRMRPLNDGVVLRCGLRNAHHHPLVGERTEDGVRSWRTSLATAW